MDSSVYVSPRDFHHPYEPYDIQNDLMNVIYSCIEEGKIGILESPTGTGKSLSLICGSLTWLRDNQQKTLEGQLTAEDTSDEPAWVVEHARDEKKKVAIEHRAVLENRLKVVRAKELRQKQQYENSEPVSKRKRVSKEDGPTTVRDDAQFELADYSSEDDHTPNKSVASQMFDGGLSSKSQQLMERLGLVSKASEEDELTPIDETKIFFCSRTHSQLSQFVQELRRVNLPDPAWVATKDNTKVEKSLENVVIKHLPLGSRKNLCINPKVSKLGSVHAINDRCLELQQSSTSKDHKCNFLPSKEKENLVNDFRDHTLAKIRDIEDLGALGKKIEICPYYASRTTIKPSEIVTLPYPLLLQKSAREALDISLKGHVIVIDEAHNLMDTISNLHSTMITQNQLRRCREQIGIYLQKFRNRLKGKNRVYVTQLVRLLDSISLYLSTKDAGTTPAEGLAEVAELMAGKGADQINLDKLVTYLKQSKLARKVEGYISYQEQEQKDQNGKAKDNSQSSMMPVLTQVQAFIQTLTNPSSEGQFFYERENQNDVCLKYTLFDPTFHFKDIVEEARAVILAGGTMSPMDDYMQHLFAYVDPERVRTFSCGHIIPRDNLLVLPMSKGVGGIDFDFTFEERKTSALIESLGQTLLEVSASIPDGLVVFFPSYSYLEQVVSFWKTKPIWSRLESLKPIFQEEKNLGVDATLNSYAQAISTGKGGLLLSVIGGKLSEGINFSDALGRGVVVVGMPYPNIHTAQWKAKLQYIEQSTFKRTGKIELGKAAAREYVENTTMRAVNQSIGRAIRHKGDYASILLLDKRYESERIVKKLPAWIKQGLVHGRDLGETKDRLRSFFEGKVGG